MAQTNLIIANSTGSGVTVWFTRAVAPGNVTIADLEGVTPVTGNPNQGTFTVPAHGQVGFSTAEGTTLIGNVCFGSPPINCPTSQWPTAVNLFEFALNLESPNWETIDISCVAGVNSLLHVVLAGGGTWNAGNTQPEVTSFHNAKPGSNTGLVGVYPILCDVCTASQNPPICSPAVPGETPQSEPICNVQRDPGSGGEVTVTFVGWT